MNKNHPSIFRLTAIAAMLLVTACGGGGGTSGTSSGNDAVVAPSITVQPASVTVTELQGTSFSVTATGAAPLSYQWLRNGKELPGATSSTLAMPSALAVDHTARYSAVVSNSAGSVTSTAAVLTQELPMFLLGGQSNMEGNPTYDLPQLLAELASGKDTQTIKVNLTERIKISNDAREKGVYTAKMGEFEASELVRLNAGGLVRTNATAPSKKVFCSMNQLPLTPLNTAPVDAQSTNCGKPFGPEQVFGEALSKAGYSSTSLIKVAYGGTTLYLDWRSPSMGGAPNANDHYAKLKARIQSLKDKPASVNSSCTARACRWSAFVWFQGENDTFDKTHGETYEQNLKNFIADVRAEVGSPTLPVVIVQIGAWGQSLPYGKNVSAAQTAVVNADNYARIVNTADLSAFYHYDAAAQLIIGERVSLAVQSLLAAEPAAK